MSDKHATEEFDKFEADMRAAAEAAAAGHPDYEVRVINLSELMDKFEARTIEAKAEFSARVAKTLRHYLLASHEAGGLYSETEVNALMVLAGLENPIQQALTSLMNTFAQLLGMPDDEPTS